MSASTSPSTLKGKRSARVAAAAAVDKENQDPRQGTSLSRSGSETGFRPAGKFSSNSSLSIAIHPPSKSSSQQFRTATCNVELPPTPITAGLDHFPGDSGKSPSPALLNIELPMTPTSAGFPSSPASSSSQAVKLPLVNAEADALNAREFEERLRLVTIASIPGAPKIGVCDSGVFSDMPSSPSLADTLPEFPAGLSDAELSMLDATVDDTDEDDDEHEAQTPMKDFGLAMGRSNVMSMQREASVQLISTSAQLEMQTAFQRRMGGSSADGFALAVHMDKGKGREKFADLTETSGLILSSHFDQLGLRDNIVPVADDNGLGLSIGPIAGPISLALPTEVASIILESKEGMPLIKGLAGLGISLHGELTKDQLAQPTLAPPGQIKPASKLPKQITSEVSPSGPWQADDTQTTPSQAPLRNPLSESRRSSNANTTPLSVVAVNRHRLGGLTPTNSPTAKVGTPTSPAKRSATAAALNSHLYLLANGKENQDPLSLSSSGSGAGFGALRGNKSSSNSSSSGSGGAPTSPEWYVSTSGPGSSRKRSRVALR